MVLRGLRVVELGELLAGPLIGTLLGEFGAEVIKIERPGRGDVLRQFGPMVDGESLYWRINARNKKSVVLDLSVDEGRQVLGDLLRTTDVLVNSLRPGTLESWGLSDLVLQETYPRLVTVNASAFGKAGPHSGRGGYDPIAQGYSGLSGLTGAADGPPMRAGGAIPVCDFTTGFAGALGAMLALYGRDVGDKAERTANVDVALYDVAFRMLGPLLAYYDLTGNVWKRDGNHSLGGAPTGHFQTEDGCWICVSVQNDEQFHRLCSLIDRPEWLQEPKYQSLKLRTQHRDEIEGAFSAWVSARPAAEALQLLEMRGLPAGPINSMADLADDPHLGVRSTVWVETNGERHRHPTRVPKLSGVPETEHRPAPRLGEDSVTVLTEVLRYSDAKVSALIGAGVVT